MLPSWRSQPPGVAELDVYASSRTATLQRLLQAEASRAADEAPDAHSGDGGTCSLQLHPQCVLDFGRAEYIVGERVFAAGEAAKLDRLDDARAEFAACFTEECGGSPRLVYAASALASQLSIALLGGVCYGGPQSYAVPSGHTLPRYTVRRVTSEAASSSASEISSNSTDAKDCPVGVEITMERISEGFDQFSLPGDEPHACLEESFIRQYARALLQIRSEGGCADEQGAQSAVICVQDAWESMKLSWPDSNLVVKDGLVLDFRSPPLPRPQTWPVLQVTAGLKLCRKTVMWQFRFVAIMVGVGLGLATLPARILALSRKALLLGTVLTALAMRRAWRKLEKHRPKTL
eukprot:TRINITY_DN24948_c0_g1_i1.p1 TRINITY_DN24948_c0_g1~~TRINITY_DN24948_c0_g1_i1.p1  ORF type:complete len:348 (-),score=49.47 TRINITY_DN24948_c0_g1_i1:45-1088(-)